MYHALRNQGQGPTTHGLKSLDRFYNAMLPCPTVMLPAKDEFKIFQHNMYFSSDKAAARLYSDSLTTLVGLTSYVALSSFIVWFQLDHVLKIDSKMLYPN